MKTRTTWRRVGVALALLLVIALAALVAFDLVSERQARAGRQTFEREFGSLTLESLVRPWLDHEDNAATWIQAGSAALALSPEQGEAATKLVRSNLADWGETERLEAAALVESARPAVEILSRALPLEKSNFAIDYTEGVRTPIPPLMPILDATRILRIDGRLAILEGDVDRVLHDVALTGRIGDALADESLLIVALMGLAVDRQAIGLIYEALPLLEPDDLARAVTSLESRDRTASFARAVRGEAAMIASISFDERVLPQYPALLRRPLALLAGPLYKRQSVRIYEGLRQLIESLDAPGGGVEAQPAETPSLLVPDLAGMLLPNLVGTSDSLRETEAARRLAWSALETYRRAREQTGYPEEAWLAPGTEPDLYAGGPVRYVRREDGSALLAADAAAERWAGRYEGRRQFPGPPYVWRLPAL